MYKTYLLKISCIVEGPGHASAGGAGLTRAGIHQHGLQVSQQLQRLGLLDQVSGLGEAGETCGPLRGKQRGQGVGQEVGRRCGEAGGRGRLLKVEQRVLKAGSRGGVSRNFGG